MSDLKAQLQSDLTHAIRSRDEVTAATLRMALTAITTEEVAGSQARVLRHGEVVAVLSREAKRRREAADAFSAAGRLDLADREMAELDVLARYLPAPLEESDVADLVAAAVAEAAEAGVTGKQAMGRVMKQVSATTAGRFDGARLAAMVRAALSA